MNFKLEIACFSIESCLVAESAGAHRIEFCAGYAEGGTTASYGSIKTIRKSINVELYPIVRPRGGDFLYSEAEFASMKTDVQLCKQLVVTA